MQHLSDRLRTLVPAWLLCWLFLGPGAPGADAQQTPPAFGGPFTWSEQGPPGGFARITDPDPAFGWVLIDEDVAIRAVPSYSPIAGLTLEVWLEAPASGHPTLPEVFLLQLPAKWPSVPAKDRALVIAFHQFGVSHKAPFLNSNLPTECARRDWMLLSPAGLSQTNFANVDSQAALDTALELVFEVLPFNFRKVYTVGFSMGGMNALSYAMRKQDPSGLRVAGVVCHTGTIDVIDEALGATGLLAEVLDDAFGTDLPLDTPEEEFALARVNPARTPTFSFLDPDRAYARNLLDLPIYFHLNNQDPNTDLVQDNRLLHAHLLSLGADVALDQVNAGFTHKWSTLPVGPALDFVSGSNVPPPVPADTPAFTLFTDLERTYKCVDVHELDPSTVGRVQVELPTGGANQLGLTQVDGIRRLGVDLSQLGVDTGAALQLATSTLDGAPTTLELSGFTAAPSLVLVNGGPPASQSYDVATGTLTITPTAGGGFGLIDVMP